MWVLPACSLGGDLLKLALSVRQSHVEFLGAGHDGFSAQFNKRDKRVEMGGEREGDEVITDATYLVLAERHWAISPA